MMTTLQNSNVDSTRLQNSDLVCMSAKTDYSIRMSIDNTGLQNSDLRFSCVALERVGLKFSATRDVMASANSAVLVDI